MIKGISDVRRLPRLGKIRLGEKRKAQSGKEYPSKLDHFNFKDVPWVAEVYGEACKELDIVVPVENQDVFFSQERKAYRLTGLFCKSSDGVTATRVRVGQADGSNPKAPKGTILDQGGEAFLKEQGISCEVGEMFELPCMGEECPFTERKMCRPIGRLMFMLPKVQRFGCYEISTTSFNSMVTINSYLEAIRHAAGRVSMIPLKLRLVPKQVQVEGKATQIFHLEMVYEGTLTSLMGYQNGRQALPAPMPAAALPAKIELDKEAPEDLMPHGGAALEEKLGGQPLPTAKESAAAAAEAAKKALTQPAAKQEQAQAQPEQEAPYEPGADPLDEEPAGPAEPPAKAKEPIWPTGEPERRPAKPAAPAPKSPKKF